MSGVFLVVAVVMTVLALAFFARPLFGSKRRKTVIALAIALPLLAAGLYVLIGSPQVESGRSMPFATAVSPTEPSSRTSHDSVGSVASMVDGLAARLEQNPDDGKGWLLLARSYKHLNRFEDAASAYSKAVSLGEIDPELAAPATPSAKANLSSAQIFGRLSLSEKAARIVQPTDTVFIFARAPNGSGVPAAVLQRPASDLPIDFILNDSQSMVEGIKLSDFDEVVVTGRVSRSGDASDALQGLEAKTDPIAVTDSNHVTLIIE